jgi:hypothetical protein
MCPSSGKKLYLCDKCCINTVVSADDGHSCPKHVEQRNKHIKKNCAPSWLYLQDQYKTLILTLQLKQLFSMNLTMS